MRWVLLLGGALLLGACTSFSRSDLAQAELGSAVYAQRCQVCHGDAATGKGAIPTAPTHGFEGHTWHHADGQIVQIVTGEFQYPGRTMPSFGGILSEEEVRAVLAYLKTTWLPEQQAFQAEVSQNWEEAQRKGP